MFCLVLYSWTVSLNVNNRCIALGNQWWEYLYIWGAIHCITFFQCHNFKVFLKWSHRWSIVRKWYYNVWFCFEASLMIGDKTSRNTHELGSLNSGKWRRMNYRKPLTWTTWSGFYSGLHMKSSDEGGGTTLSDITSMMERWS